jgi:hypothetical protein
LRVAYQSWPHDLAAIAAYVAGALLVIHSIWLGISRRPAPREGISFFWGALLLALLILCGLIIHSLYS